MPLAWWSPQQQWEAETLSLAEAVKEDIPIKDLFEIALNFQVDVVLTEDLSSPKPGHTTGGSGRGGAQRGGRGGAGRAGTPAGQIAQETTVPLAHQGIEDNCPGRLFGSTNKRNPM